MKICDRCMDPKTAMSVQSYSFGLMSKEKLVVEPRRVAHEIDLCSRCVGSLEQTIAQMSLFVKGTDPEKPWETKPLKA